RDAPVTRAVFPFKRPMTVVLLCLRVSSTSPQSAAAVGSSSWANGQQQLGSNLPTAAVDCRLPLPSANLCAFENGGDSLAAADTQRYQGAPAARARQLIECLDCQDAAGRPDRVAERDATAVRVGAVRGQLQAAHHGQRLGGKGLVDFKDVDVFQIQPGF